MAADAGKSSGQFGYDYFISLVIFILFVVYIAFQIMGMRPAYLREVRNEILRSEAYQLSELLVNDPGEPLNWDDLPFGVRIGRIGLSDENTNKTNYVSNAKIVKLNTSWCPLWPSGYSGDLPKLFGIDPKYQFSIIIKKMDGTLLADCHPPQSKLIAPRTLSISVKRTMVFDSGGYGEVLVQMW